jgi:hypothetical protein
VPGRLGKATSRTPSMYVDEAIVLGEATEQGEATFGGSRGGKSLSQGEQPLGGHGSDTEPKCRVDPNDGCALDESVTSSFIARRLTQGRSPVR